MSDTKEKKIPRHERLFPKLIHLPKERKAEFEAMAKKEDLKLATWIQSNVGNFSELEAYIKDYKEQAEWNIEGEHFKVTQGKKTACEEILKFIEALKTKA